MLVSMNKKHSELIDKLVYIAGGDLGVVTAAVAACANGSDAADLKDVVEWIVKHREAPSPPVAEPTPYDRELGAYSDQDREYAKEIADELSLTSADEIDTLVQWLRKHRYESVIADRKRRHITELTQGEIEATQSCLSGFHTQVLDVDAR